MPCIQVQVQADSQESKARYMHTDRMDRGVDSSHRLALPSSPGFVIPHNTSIIPRLPGRILRLSDRPPAVLTASCSSHCPGPGPVRINMLCGTVHAFNDIHLNATIQSSAMCPATYTTTSLNPQAKDQVPSKIITLHDRPEPSRPQTPPTSAPATSPQTTFHTSCTSLGTCGRGDLPWPSCARQTPT